MGIENKFDELVCDIYTRGLDLDHRVEAEYDEAFLYVWDSRNCEYTAVVCYGTDEECLFELESQYRVAIDFLASWQCSDAYSAIVGSCHEIYAAGYNECDAWWDIVASEIIARLDYYDLWTAVNDSKSIGHWQVAAEIEAELRRAELEERE